MDLMECFSLAPVHTGVLGNGWLLIGQWNLTLFTSHRLVQTNVSLAIWPLLVVVKLPKREKAYNFQILRFIWDVTVFFQSWCSNVTLRNSQRCFFFFFTGLI